jgi:hypothetical protein
MSHAERAAIEAGKKYVAAPFPDFDPTSKCSTASSSTTTGDSAGSAIEPPSAKGGDRFEESTPLAFVPVPMARRRGFDQQGPRE